LKKRSKKLLLPRSGRRRAPNNQKFFGSFFQKRTAFFLHPIALHCPRGDEQAAPRSARPATPDA
jgi:hypothetical protein